MASNRIVEIQSGTIMVVSDLHGDGDAYDRYIATFRSLYEMGEVDRLIILGDLIHGYASEAEDASIRMILDVIDLQERYGKDKIIMLLGNHEMPHIYGVSLAKGDLEFTPRFERMLGEHRRKIIHFIKSLPFFVRTPNLLLCHAGPDDGSINRVMRLVNFDHDDLLRDADATLAQQGDLDEVYEAYAKMSGISYDELAKEYLAVSGPEDPRYSHLMRALFISERDQRFGFLWDLLFTQNERDLIPATYEQTCRQFLDAFSTGGRNLKVCVSGHIVTPDGGHTVVNDRHFRFASATHARPRESGGYLLLDTTESFGSANELTPHFRSVF